MIDLNLIYLGIALLLAPALGEIGKIRAKADKGFLWLGAAGGLFILSAAFGVDLTLFGLDATVLEWGTAVFSVIGLIAVIIGTIMIFTNVFK